MRVNAVFVSALAAAGIFGIFVACDSDKPFGEIVIAVQTDVALPDSVDQIRIEAHLKGELKFGSNYDVGAGKSAIPATLGMLQSENPGDTFLFRLIARKAGKVKMLREVTTSVPSRIASLRMPIRWLCDDSAKETAPNDVTNATCPANQTCIGGACYDIAVDPNELDDYSEGTTNGACFDVVSCMGGGTPVVPDASCTIEAPPSTGQGKLNIALRVEGDGICDASQKQCFVILEPTVRPNAPIEGWRVQGNRIALAPGVCARLATGRVKEVIVSSGCATKNIGGPVCGSWSGLNLVPDAPPGGNPTNDAAGSDSGGIDAGPPGTITTLVTGVVGDRVTNQCPIAFSGDFLFLCTTNPTISAGVPRLRSLRFPLTSAGPGELLIPYAFPGGSFGGPVVTPDHLYWWSYDSLDLTQQIVRNIDAKTLVVGEAAPVKFGEQIDDTLPQQFAWDTTSVYVSGTSKIFKIPRLGGPPAALLANTTTNVAGVIVSDEDPNGYLYISTAKTIERLSKITAETVVLGTVPETSIISMLVTTDKIYVTSAMTPGGSSFLYTLPKTGGVPAKLLTGSGFAAPPTNLTVDGDYLYWMYPPSQQPGPTILRTKTTGGPQENAEIHVKDPRGDTKLFGFVIRPDRIYYAADISDGGQNQIKIAAYTR